MRNKPHRNDMMRQDSNSQGEKTVCLRLTKTQIDIFGKKKEGRKTKGSGKEHFKLLRAIRHTAA